MEGNRSRRKGKELAMKVPPSSVAASSSSTPRALLRSLVRFPRHCMKKEEEKKGRQDGELQVIMNTSSSEVLEPVATLEEEDQSTVKEALASPGREPDTVPLNPLIGVGLVLFFVKTATEFNKMIELQRRMEILLADIKGEMKMKNVTSSFSETKNETVFSSSNCWVEESSINSKSLPNNGVSYHLLGRQVGKESVRKTKCDKKLERKRCLKINQLEDELEVELKRLQIKMDMEDPSVDPPLHRKELDSDNTDQSESSSPDFEEVSNEPKQEANRETNGVCPRELERRLHELLESRQQERIAELESELECAERRLQEKETEISWWRDTARLVSKHKEVTLLR